MTPPYDVARGYVADYVNDHLDKTDAVLFTTDEVFVVWFCYILGGWKALLSTTITDGMYYEVTHNTAKKETYLDAYKKFQNICIKE